MGTFALAPKKVDRPNSAIPVLGRKIEVHTSAMRLARPKTTSKFIVAELNTRSTRPPCGVTWARTRWTRPRSPQCRNSGRRLPSPKSSAKKAINKQQLARILSVIAIFQQLWSNAVGFGATFERKLRVCRSAGFSIDGNGLSLDQGNALPRVAQHVEYLHCGRR